MERRSSGPSTPCNHLTVSYSMFSGDTTFIGQEEHIYIYMLETGPSGVGD